MTSSVRSRIAGARRAIWRLGVVPYNAAVLLGMAAVMLESVGWKLRSSAPERARR